jgi:hypothetical protein
MLALTLGTTMLFIFWSVVINQTDTGFGAVTSKRAPEQLMYVNPGIAMLDVVANTEPGGFGGISSALAQLRGNAPSFDGGMDCQGDVCRPVDNFGNPIQDGFDTQVGYWWPRVALTFVVLSILLTFASMRLVVPAGMRWALRRRGGHAAAAARGAADSGDGAPMIEELGEAER